MKSKIFYGVSCFLLGMIFLIFPQLVKYFDTSSFFFDFSKFLEDYPMFSIPAGIVFMIISAISIILFFINKNQEETAYIIQRASGDDYGTIDMHFPKISIGNRDEAIYENVVGLKNNSQDFIELEKQRIRRFYCGFNCKKSLAIMGISPIPALVYSGFVVSDCGPKIKYYHWNRKAGKAVKIHKFGKNIELSVDEEVCRESNDYVLCVSSSYNIDKNIVKSQFVNENLMFLKTNIIGTDSIKSEKDICAVADKIRKIISEKENPKASFHLLLSCSSELCFGIGRKLNSPALSKIYVYNLNMNKEHPWDWRIELK